MKTQSQKSCSNCRWLRLATRNDSYDSCLQERPEFESFADMLGLIDEDVHWNNDLVQIGDQLYSSGAVPDIAPEYTYERRATWNASDFELSLLNRFLWYMRVLRYTPDDIYIDPEADEKEVAADKLYLLLNTVPQSDHMVFETTWTKEEMEDPAVQQAAAAYQKAILGDRTEMWGQHFGNENYLKTYLLERCSCPAWCSRGKDAQPDLDLLRQEIRDVLHPEDEQARRAADKRKRYVRECRAYQRARRLESEW